MKEELLSTQSMSSLPCSPHRTVPKITNRGMVFVPSFFPGAKSSRSSFNDALSNVKVHRSDSAKRSAGFGAFAYARGIDISLSAGQEKFVSHEASHVVQQKRGRART